MYYVCIIYCSPAVEVEGIAAAFCGGEVEGIVAALCGGVVGSKVVCGGVGTMPSGGHGEEVAKTLLYRLVWPVTLKDRLNTST